MESIVAQRIKSVLDDKQISIAAFAKRIGMQQVTCNRQLRGDQAVSLVLLDAFLQEFSNISAEWLLRGRGEMLLDAEANVGLQVPADSDSVWHARYDELEKRYDQLLAILGGGRSIGRQAKTG